MATHYTHLCLAVAFVVNITPLHNAIVQCMVSFTLHCTIVIDNIQPAPNFACVLVFLNLFYCKWVYQLITKRIVQVDLKAFVCHEISWQNSILYSRHAFSDNLHVLFLNFAIHLTLLLDHYLHIPLSFAVYSHHFIYIWKCLNFKNVLHCSRKCLCNWNFLRSLSIQVWMWLIPLVQ